MKKRWNYFRSSNVFFLKNLLKCFNNHKIITSK